ncbi:MAG: hypothetical protein HQK89_15930 [Nitrospirae bacterium]|nr:hypothetical protein [Nitrospirota bacterium]
MAGNLKPAHYEHGRAVEVKSFKVGKDGGTLEAGNTGTPIDGTVVVIPGGALSNDTIISLGYNDGTLDLRAGKACGVVIVLSAEPDVTFQRPVTLKVKFDHSNTKLTLTGYEIDDRGRLHLLDIGYLNKDTGDASFYTFKPLTFTWVYIYY